MSQRRVRILAVFLCFAVFWGTSLGLNNGMVIGFDDHGHVAVEAAHVEHVHRHADGDHHGDEGPGPDHEALHDAIASCFASHTVQTRQHSPRVHELRLGDPTEAAPLVITAVAPTLSAVSNRCGACDLLGTTARAELACLSAIVLLV